MIASTQQAYAITEWHDTEMILAKLDGTPKDETAGEHVDSSDPKRPLKYLRVLVDSNDGDKVNIRVPIALVKTGLMLSTVIPVAASDELKKQGVDLSGLNGLGGDELMEALRDLNIDVDSSDGDTVRVFCE